MGIHDYIDFVIRNDQNLDTFNLLQEGYDDRTDFIENIYFESESAGYAKAVLVFIPDIKTKEEIFQIPLIELKKYDSVLAFYSWDKWGFRDYKGYSDVLSNEQNLIWSSWSKPGYWILNFVPKIYKIFVTQEISYEKLPMWMYSTILSNRGIYIKVSFPSLNKNDMFKMIVYDAFPRKKDVTFHDFENDSFPEFSQEKPIISKRMKYKLYISPAFQLESQGYATRVSTMLPQFNDVSVCSPVLNYKNIDFNIHLPSKTCQKFENGMQVYLKMRVASKIYQNIEQLIKKICIFPKCRKKKRIGNNFCKKHRNFNISESISKYEEIVPIGTREIINFFIEKRRRKIEKKIKNIDETISLAKDTISDLLNTQVLELIIKYDGKEYEITLK